MQGLWGCTLSFTLTSGPLFVAALRAKPAAQHFIVDASGTGNSGTDASNRRTLTPQRYRQQLMVRFCVCPMLRALEACGRAA